MPEAPFPEFAARLHQALDRYGFPAARSRTGALAVRYNVTRETARKWLGGLALPELERLIGMAVDFRVSLEWLATGRGVPDMTRIADTPLSYPPPDPELQRLHEWLGTLTPRQRQGLLQFING